MMKKIVSCVFAALLLCAALTGCGGDRGVTQPSPTPGASVSPSPVPTPGASTLPEVTDELLPDPEDGEVRDEDGVITEDDSGAKRPDDTTGTSGTSGKSGTTGTSSGKLGAMIGGKTN